MDQPTIRQGVDGYRCHAPHDRADRGDIPARTRREPSLRPRGCDAWVPRRRESGEQPRGASCHPQSQAGRRSQLAIEQLANRVRRIPEPLRRLAGYCPAVPEYGRLKTEISEPCDARRLGRAVLGDHRGERRIRPLRRPLAASPAKSTPPPRSRRNGHVPRVWPGVWIAVKPGTDIGPSAVSLVHRNRLRRRHDGCHDPHEALRRLGLRAAAISCASIA